MQSEEEIEVTTDLKSNGVNKGTRPTVTILKKKRKIIGTMKTLTWFATVPFATTICHRGYGIRFEGTANGYSSGRHRRTGFGPSHGHRLCVWCLLYCGTIDSNSICPLQGCEKREIRVPRWWPTLNVAAAATDDGVSRRDVVRAHTTYRSACGTVIGIVSTGQRFSPRNFGSLL